jgi:hypothetical protein
LILAVAKRLISWALLSAEHVGDQNKAGGPELKLRASCSLRSPTADLTLDSIGRERFVFPWSVRPRPFESHFFGLYVPRNHVEGIAILILNSLKRGSVARLAGRRYET